MNWKHTIDIKQYIGDDERTLAERVTGIKEEFEKLPLDVPWDISDALDEAQTTDDVETFDDALEMIYDWADENSVWLGV